jgi:hypothetical protein
VLAAAAIQVILLGLRLDQMLLQSGQCFLAFRDRQTERLWRTGSRRAFADADLTQFYDTGLSRQFHQDPPPHLTLPVQYQQVRHTPWVGPPGGLTWYGGERRTRRPFHKAA